METIESFMQYTLCELCRVNEAKQFLKKPEVHDLLWEDGAKVWCYFCAQEVEKHGRKAETALSVHSHNFLLHLATAESLIDAVEKAYLEKMERLHQKTIAAIQKTDKHRVDIVMQARLEGPVLLQATKGNIHTGAKPPWLDDDSDEDDGGGPTPAKQPCIGEISKVPIGPTIEDFQKHLFMEKRKKLNPNRVGANFDHFSETSQEWLPSFGRVWNFGRRWQSRNQYRMEEKTARHWKRPKEY